MKPNEVINHLYNIYRENKFSHAYLVETNNIELCLNDISKLIKMTFCPNEYKDNCNDCNLCNLMNLGYLPSVYIIKPSGKTINKDDIDLLKEKFSYNPLYTVNNYYIICEAEKMNDTAYNKLLKFLEEPEDNIIGFYICNNIQKMPDTIVSRLEQVKMLYANDYEEDSDKYLLAKEYLEIILKDNENGIWYNNSVLCKRITERTDFIILFKSMLDLCLKDNNIFLANLIKRYLEKLEYNVNIPLILDSFVIEAGEKDGI